MAELRARLGRPQTSSQQSYCWPSQGGSSVFCFGSLAILDVVCRYLSLFVLYINIEIGKIDVKC